MHKQRILHAAVNVIEYGCEMSSFVLKIEKKNCTGDGYKRFQMVHCAWEFL